MATAKQWADAFMASDRKQLIALVVEAGAEPDWREVFLAWLDASLEGQEDAYFRLLLVARLGLLPLPIQDAPADKMTARTVASVRRIMGGVEREEQTRERLEKATAEAAEVLRCGHCPWSHQSPEAIAREVSHLIREWMLDPGSPSGAAP